MMTTEGNRTAGVHWLTFTTQTRIGTVVSRVDRLFRASLEEAERGGLGYAQSYIGVAGVRVFFSEDRPEVCVWIPGEACELVGTEELLTLAQGLVGKVTRLDLAWDGVPFTPAECRSAWERGDVRTVANRDSWRWHESETGTTFYAGKRSSDRFLRVYDARGPVRVELELKGARAEACGQVLYDLLLERRLGEFAEVTMGWLRDYIDFVDSRSSDHTSRRKLLPWWQELTSGVEKVRLTLGGGVDGSIERTVQWLERSVAPALAMWLGTLPREEAPQALLSLVRMGNRNMSPQQRALVRFAHEY